MRAGSPDRDVRTRCDFINPSRLRLVCNGPVELNDVVLVNFLDRLRRASPPQIRAARIHGPWHFGDLARDQRVVLRSRGAKRDFGFAFGKVEDAVHHHKLHLEAGIALVKNVEQRGFNDPVTRGFGTGDADRANEFGLTRGDVACEIRNVDLYALCNGAKLLPEAGQPITLRTALKQWPSELALKGSDPPLHG